MRELPHDLGWIARTCATCEPTLMEEVCPHCPALLLSPRAGWGMDHPAPHGAALGMGVCLAVALRCGSHARRASPQPNPDGHYRSRALWPAAQPLGFSRCAACDRQSGAAPGRFSGGGAPSPLTLATVGVARDRALAVDCGHRD